MPQKTQRTTGIIVLAGLAVAASLIGVNLLTSERVRRSATGAAGNNRSPGNPGSGTSWLALGGPREHPGPGPGRLGDEFLGRWWALRAYQ
jgi:hypothetical protein